MPLQEHTIGVNGFLPSLEWMSIESKCEEDTTQPELGFTITHHRSPASTDLNTLEQVHSAVNSALF